MFDTDNFFKNYEQNLTSLNEEFTQDDFNMHKKNYALLRCAAIFVKRSLAYCTSEALIQSYSLSYLEC